VCVCGMVCSFDLCGAVSFEVLLLSKENRPVRFKVSRSFYNSNTRNIHRQGKKKQREKESVERHFITIIFFFFKNFFIFIYCSLL
jgi:hypothetical protein